MFLDMVSRNMQRSRAIKIDEGWNSNVISCIPRNNHHGGMRLENQEQRKV